MRRATQGCGGPTVLGTQNPSVPLLHPPDERLPLQVGPVGPVWLLGFQPSPPHSRQPEGERRREHSRALYRKVPGGAGPHFHSPLTGQNPVPRQRNQERRFLSALLPQVKAGSEGGRERGLGVGVGSCSLCQSDRRGPAPLDTETL